VLAGSQWHASRELMRVTTMSATDILAAAPDMATSLPRSGSTSIEGCIPEILAFATPYLLAKLERLGVCETRLESQALVQETKKYLVLSEMYPQVEIPMFSTRVDEAWHQFALFTKEYARFCARFAGRFIHHGPAEADSLDCERAALPQMTFEEYQTVYETVFGPISDLWFDERHIGPGTRLRAERWAMPFEAYVEQGQVVLARGGADAMVLCRASLVAQGALEFVTRHRIFYVRELPGPLGDADRVALCAPLVLCRVLSVAP
jgi:hypothetical protein